ncbi:MAG: hypothetical protein B6U89_00580 [Desulfurococcales archaeon ex4484_58]|nr:MAG: hypothetical protein B6U89_00580 [Desulfurococcales archaeon ex4484_58]
MLSPYEVVMWTLLGTGFGVLLSWIPGFHIYNLMALIMITYPVFMEVPESFPFFALGALVAFVYLSILPSVYLSVADESLILMLFPTQRYLVLGRGHEAVWLSLLGAVGGSIILVILGLTVIPVILPPLYLLFSPYITWILLAIVVFMFLSEWLKAGDREKTPSRRLWVAWQQSLGGIFVFLAAGLLGFFVMNTGFVPAKFAYVRLTPMFIGFFGMPWVLQNILSRRHIPRQDTRDKIEASMFGIANGTIAGAFGGYIAAFFPIVTGGMGALVAGHMASSRGDDVFIVSQGANRVLYYVGAFFLLFVPTARLTRGAGAWLVSSIYTPKTWIEFYYAAGAILLAAGISFISTIYMSKLLARILTQMNYVKLSYVVAVLLAIITYLLADIPGLIVLAVATIIGLASVVFNTRRSYCLGGLIFPVLISMTGQTGTLLQFFGLTPQALMGG